MTSKKEIEEALEKAKDLEEKDKGLLDIDELKQDDDEFMEEAKDLKDDLKPAWYLNKQGKKKKKGKDKKKED